MTMASLVGILLLIIVQVSGQVPPAVLEPAIDVAVPDNTRENVTYTCMSPPAGLSLLWEVDNLQITPSRVASFQDQGIFIMNTTTLVFTEQALSQTGREYQIQCLIFNATDFSSSLSDPIFLRVFGPPSPVVGLTVLPFSEDSVELVWGRPPNSLPEEEITYMVRIPGLMVNATTNTTSFEATDSSRNGDCMNHQFIVSAMNEAGTGASVTIEESIPISPDLSETESSLSLLSLDLSPPSAAQITVSFLRATSCSSNFPVTNHSVVVMGEGGGEVGRVLAEPSSDPLVVTVADLPLDARLEVAVEACNELFCRTSSTLQLLTTDVQSASILFFETFVFLNCTFASGSLARGCVVTLQLETEVEGGEGREEGGEERFWLERENGASEVTQCNRTQNSRIAYQIISAVDWESDGSIGSYSIPVADNVTENEEEFPCPTTVGGGGSDGLSAGAVAGIVIAVTVVAVVVMLAIVLAVFLIYYRTRDVKKKANGAISIEERSLLPSSERVNISDLNASPPYASLPVTSLPNEHDSGTIRSTASLPPQRLQSTIDCGPLAELTIPPGKKGKIHMHIWSDTLERCKRTGKRSFHLLPLLEDAELPST